ncbi:transcriptional regulator, TetR family [Sporobacter termitidis DSM 10068]|uniref:Transcriptional regulator, TetR family n=1 Tax=Sporobacter termitidis DSM 10068 TaxID=1123282 RepID=A0A1M5YXZ5_9FIRM|nr:TetR/AcrR family transcriptional regulator [Sporobacter termitidis]SHI16886.1 transcriptional regulator, TetR family [Sporobacter termitidis DSM 10068]
MNESPAQYPEKAAPLTTREKILAEALDLFSVRGYDAVSVRDIAGAVGIKESSLYNHFKNKQDIFDSIVREYSGRWEEIFSSLSLTGADRQIVVDERTVAMYKNMTNAQFAAIAGAIFDYYMTDALNVKLRRMLTIEQYGNEDIRALFRRISFDDSIDFQSRLFAALMDAGCFVRADPYILALEFFSPIFLIFYKYDNDPESLARAKALFSRHIGSFTATYGKTPEKEEGAQ